LRRAREEGIPSGDKEGEGAEEGEEVEGGTDEASA
jgi:hypothetical protein